MMKTNMPTYTFINTETKEEFDIFLSWSERDDYLENNTQLSQVIRYAPSIGYNDAKKPDEGFRDILRDIKKGSGAGNDINTF